ncbi:hypothetical protein SCHPADRAFT_436140 [Schizopora paradoxa]|uniref:Uncharacterized protein n=1 Tax=Schizopora paradoxa TaxID=27342 RepID=A0A0H2RKI5_9AGAM|nr:hypothetical protein SCHPADRAFT_436140 [Schizopora paradoxa]
MSLRSVQGFARRSADIHKPTAFIETCVNREASTTLALTRKIPILPNLACRSTGHSKAVERKDVCLSTRVVHCRMFSIFSCVRSSLRFSDFRSLTLLRLSTSVPCSTQIIHPFIIHPLSIPCCPRLYLSCPSVELVANPSIDSTASRIRERSGSEGCLWCIAALGRNGYRTMWFIIIIGSHRIVFSKSRFHFIQLVLRLRLPLRSPFYTFRFA